MNSESTSIARQTGVTLSSTDDAIRLAQVLGSASMLPRHIKSAADAVLLMLTGAELGIPPMASLRGLHLVEGKVTMSAELLLATALSRGVKVKWVETSDTAARVTLSRDGHDPLDMAFTIEDAKRAGLAGKDNWRKYPAAMLRARCLSASLRAFCPDLLAGGGLYVDGEIESVSVSAEVVRDEPEPEVDPGVLADITKRIDAAAESGDAATIERIAREELAAMKLGAVDKARMKKTYRDAIARADEVATPAPDEAESEGGCGSDDV